MPPFESKSKNTTDQRVVLLHRHAEKEIESHHVKEFLNPPNGQKPEAVYVIAEHPTPTLHYIHRSDQQIRPLVLNDSIDNLVGKLSCVHDYHQRQQAVLCPKDLQTIAWWCEYHDTHQSDYIVKLVDAFKALESIDEFNLNDTNLYREAIARYEVFIHAYFADFIKISGVRLLPKLPEDFFISSEFEISPNNFDVFAKLAEYTFLSKEDLVFKLTPSSDTVHMLLSRKNRQAIIYGINQLEYLLSLPKEQPIFSEYFNKRFHSERNLVVDFLLEETAAIDYWYLAGGSYQEDIKRQFRDKGTLRELALIAALKTECQGYIEYLGQNPKNDQSKITSVTELNNILNRSDIPASRKISDFQTLFQLSKDHLSAHRDSPTRLFFIRTAYVLSSFLLGAGLIYSYAKNGTCNFFKSKGERVSDQIESYLSDSPTSSR